MRIKILIMITKFIRIKHYTFCTEGISRYVINSRIGGSSKEPLYDLYAGRFQNNALSSYKSRVKKYGTTIITTAEECIKAVEVLKKVDNIVAWDTQTMDLDIKNESPVGNGKILCASFFAGPQYDFGNGPKVFIDNFGVNAGLINYFKDYLEAQEHKKCWHNYGFDRHLFFNHGINVRGFGGDTMHMARLYDPSKMFGEYALSSLTKQYAKGLEKILGIYQSKKKKMYTQRMQAEQSEEKKCYYKQLLENSDKYASIFADSFKMQKIKMENLFARKKILKNGTEGKTYEFPTTLTLHTTETYLEKWVNYSVLDAESTFFLREALQPALRNQKSKQYAGIENSWMIYEKYWKDLGQLLTQMEREGFKIDIDHMRNIEKKCIEEIENYREKFMNFLMKNQTHPNIDLFNPSSYMQMQQLLHAPFTINKEAQKNEQTKRQNYENDQEMQDLIDTAEEIEQVDVTKRIVNRKQITQLPLIKTFNVDNDNPARGKKKIGMEIVGLGIPPIKITPTGLPAVDASTLTELAGSPENGQYGKAYDHLKEMGKQQQGKQLCEALESLIKLRHLETLLQTFIQPLQNCTDENDRIHCSLNINTQTGRLSSKKPNLQNQPAYSKDIYKIRSAFKAEKGNKLIVADYGQLQLRVLAHLTDCKKMIEAFKSGGDFHSRTAIGMFDYIQKDLEGGKILLQWDKSKGEAPLPLLKDKYADERKKAKTVNFSIAYGKTAQGFAQDWNCSITQAKEVIKKWFSDRPEVQKWQKQKQEIAKNKMFTQTLLGRYRRLDKFFSSGSKKGSFYGMGLRRSINTPVQGGAADIVIAAMVKIHKNQELKDLGWKLLLQIHDQLILEGPEQTAEQAFQIVKNNMCHPFQKDLLIELEVDAKLGDNWYECK